MLSLIFSSHSRGASLVAIVNSATELSIQFNFTKITLYFKSPNLGPKTQWSPCQWNREPKSWQDPSLQSSTFQQISFTLPSTDMDAHSKSMAGQQRFKSLPFQIRTTQMNDVPLIPKPLFILQATDQDTLETIFRSFSGLDSVDHYTSLHITALTLVFASQELEK